MNNTYKTKHGILSGVLLMLPLFVNAQQVNQNDALTKAKMFVAKSLVQGADANARVRGSQSHISCDVAYEAKSSQGTNFYVINISSGGYVIVSGEEKVKNQILGYSTSGSFDINTIPDGLKALLSDYNEEISQLRYASMSQEEDPSRGVIKEVDAGTIVVDKLVQTEWSQSNPYNMRCDGNLTGCVATAMAQVMNYWKYPAHPTQQLVEDKRMSNYYVGVNWCEDYGENYADPESVYNYEYEWDKMRNSYSTNASYTLSDKGVSSLTRLMKDAGVSVNMNYGVDWSGADIESVPNALTKYFNYRNTAEYISLEGVKLEQWLPILKNELDNHRPVIFGSTTSIYSQIGHCYIIDGYTDDDMLHFNFGFENGRGDGWYVLTIEDTESFYPHYDTVSGKIAVIGIEPPQM